MLAETDPLLAIVTAILAFASTCFAGVMSYFMMKFKAGQDTQALALSTANKKTNSKLDETADTLLASDAKVALKLSEIHSLVNSAMDAQLTANAILLRRVANLTKNEADIQAANDAESHIRDKSSLSARSPYRASGSFILVHGKDVGSDKVQILYRLPKALWDADNGERFMADLRRNGMTDLSIEEVQQ
jgi:hypothetical protein